METKPEITANLTFGESLESHTDRVDRFTYGKPMAVDEITLEKYHARTESIASCILDMMLEKTLMYGGNDNTEAFEDKMDRAYYELTRKSNRLNTLRKRVYKGDDSAKAEMLDTFVDIVGYGLLAINSTLEELQGE